jgi:hypothetical protein
VPPLSAPLTSGPYDPIYHPLPLSPLSTFRRAQCRHEVENGKAIPAVPHSNRLTHALDGCHIEDPRHPDLPQLAPAYRDMSTMAYTAYRTPATTVLPLGRPLLQIGGTKTTTHAPLPKTLAQRA